MIYDAYNIPEGKSLDCDICIVGAGAAGISMAMELNNANQDVILLESGGMNFEKNTQELYRGSVCSAKYHAPLEQYRERRFGGTTTVWGGRGAPLDDIDFEERPHVPDSGWPIKKSDLDPYYEKAQKHLHLGAYSYRAGDALDDTYAELIPGLHSDEIDTDKLWLFSLPTDLGKTNLNEIKKSKTIKLFLHANCIGINADTNGKRIRNLTVSSLADNEFEVRAKNFVLASGGLEVTRLLLNSNDAHQNGLGNMGGKLGKYYMSHVSGSYGEIKLTPKGSKEVIWGYEKTREGVYCRRCISFNEQTQKSQNLLNFRAILDHPSPHDPSHNNGILSAMYLAKIFFAKRIPPEYSKQLSGMSRYQQVLKHTMNIALDTPKLAIFSQMWLRKRILAQRKLPSLILKSSNNRYSIHYDAEQTPNQNSRVTLSEEKDRFGLQRLKVDWRFSECDIKNVCNSFKLINSELEKSGSGSIEADFNEMPEIIKEKIGVGSHHIGTTRMSSSASEGVVDQNCKVHGLENLFVASSSVFPTAGCVNPTLTIVALSLRLADHLSVAN